MFVNLKIAFFDVSLNCIFNYREINEFLSQKMIFHSKGEFDKSCLRFGKFIYREKFEKPIQGGSRIIRK